MNNVKALVGHLLRNQWVFRLIGIIVFVLILLKIDLGEALRALTTVDPLFLILSLAFQAVALVVATLRWQLIMHRLEIRIAFSRSLIHQLIGTAAAVVTPGQLGEFIKVLYHRSHGFPVPESLLSVLVDRTLDLLILLVFGFIALAILFGIPPTVTLAIALSGGIAVVIALFFARNREGSARWIGTALARISPKAYRETMQRNARHLAQLIGGFKPGFLVMCGFLSIVNYALLLLRIYSLVLALHMDVPFWYFAMVVPLLRLVGLIPISVSGIGTRDVTTIYLFARVGISAESSLVLSMLGLLTLTLQALVGLLAWWRYPLQFGREELPSLRQLSSKEGEDVCREEQAASQREVRLL
jgi:uncharacterized protein (TIRG00374 family)